MSNQDNTDMLLDALRRVGVVIPDAKPIPVRQDSTSRVLLERRYWLVRNGVFETVVSSQDASNYENALHVALEPLQPWYIDATHLDEATVEEIDRDTYIKWLKRGIS